MRAEELRIGNWVFDTIYKKMVQVETIGEEGINIYLDSGLGDNDYWIEAEYSFADLRPIPLTEAVLLKCGFVKKTSSFVYLSLKGSARPVSLKCQGKSFFYLSTPVFSINQLQNIIFVVSGEELKLNL
jgi:hypothetical protein